MFRRLVMFSLLSVLTSGGIAGCSGGGPDVQYVEGVVTLDGKPVEGATVGFSPVDAATGLAAVGTTDADGVFRLTAMQGGEPESGTTVGQYKVTVTKTTVTSASAEETQKMQDDPNYGKTSQGISAPPKAIAEVPTKYNNPETSGIEVTVKDGRNDGPEFKFELKKS